MLNYLFWFISFCCFTIHITFLSCCDFWIQALSIGLGYESNPQKAPITQPNVIQCSTSSTIYKKDDPIHIKSNNIFQENNKSYLLTLIVFLSNLRYLSVGIKSIVFMLSCICVYTFVVKPQRVAHRKINKSSLDQIARHQA